MQNYIVKTDTIEEWIREYARPEEINIPLANISYLFVPAEKMEAFLEDARRSGGNFGISEPVESCERLQEAKLEAEYAMMQDFLSNDQDERIHFYTSMGCGRLRQTVNIMKLAATDNDSHVALHMLEHLRCYLKSGKYNIRHALFVMLAVETQVLGKNGKGRCVECVARNTQQGCILRQCTELYLQQGDVDVLMEQLASEIRLKVKQRLRCHSSVSNEIVQAMVEYINENYHRNISLKQLSERFYLNPGYICRIFKREVGLSLSNYLVQLRIRHSCRMLRHSNMTVAEISQRCGYSDYFYFARQFKRIMNVTPTQYRSQFGVEKEKDADVC